MTSQDFNLILTFVMLIQLIGCSLLPMKNTISFEVAYDDAQSIVFKNTWPKCSYPTISPQEKYITIFRYCNYVQPSGYIPDEIVIEYAPWLTMEQEESKIGLFPEKAFSDRTLGNSSKAQLQEVEGWYQRQSQLVDKLPPSAWRKIVLHPKELVKKYKGIDPEGEGLRSSGKVLSYNITLHKNGTNEITDYQNWMFKASNSWMH